jgi:XRE family aerobic/anaerobic benzoate catabolism transcriptional regulator
MADHPQAMSDLRSLLATREPLYASASHTVETSGRPVDRIVEEIAGLSNVRLSASGPGASADLP